MAKQAGQTHPTRIAVACQGGGSHTAFTAGVLDRLLESTDPRFEIVALSGTSGGAVCALFAWCGLAGKAPEEGRRLLGRFWDDNSARTLAEVVLNDWGIGAARLPVEARVSPYYPGFSWLPQQAAFQADVTGRALRWGEYLWGAVPGAAQAEQALRRIVERTALRPEFVDLEDLLEEHLRGRELPGRKARPRLLVGAVDVRSGAFRAFDSDREQIEVDQILASAAVPTLFQAVRADGGLYWDGLFSQNPPVREFVKDVPLEEKPDEIWVVQINPRTRKTEPRSAAEILDRRNELSGNVSLEQELDGIKTVNKVVAATEALLAGVPEAASSPAAAPLRRYKTVKIHRIPLDGETLPGGGRLDYASKLDRRPSFLEELREHGRSRADMFLRDWPDNVACEM